MPNWLPSVIATAHELVSQAKVRFTHKSLRELDRLDLGLDVDDDDEEAR